MMIKPLSSPTPRVARKKCTGALLGCFAGAALQLLPFGSIAAPPVISNVEVLVQNDATVIRNLLERNVISGTQPMVIVAATNSSPDLGDPILAGDLCLEIQYVLVEDGNGNELPQTIDLTVRNLDGEQTGQFTIRDGEDSIDSVCDTMGVAPTADAGGPYTAEIPPGAAEASVQLDGSGSSDDNDVDLASWTWQIRQDASTGPLVATVTGEMAEVMLPEGTYVAVLTVTDRDGELLNVQGAPVDESKSDTAEATITVGPTPPPTEVPVSNAGPDQTLTDDDDDGFETVQLDGSQSTDDVAIVSYSWSEAGQEIATGAQPAPLSLPVGTHTIVLTVTDEDGLSDDDTVVITIGDAPPGRQLSSMSGLAPHEQSMATLIDNLCPRLEARANDSTITRTEGEEQLFAACSGLKSTSTTDAQARAGLQAMAGEEIVAEQTNALDYSDVQLSNVGARIVALRRGTGGGVSIAGLNLSHDGRAVPLSQLGGFIDQLLNGGAASGDEDEEGGGLLGSRLGVFVNGNVRTGDKDETANEAGFDFDGWGITAGVDYRFTDSLVLGLSLGYNESETEFTGNGGGMDGDGTSLSLYGTYFNDNLYFDFIGSTGSVDFDSARRIVYTDVGGTQDFTAVGQTDGDLTSFGVSFGYDFHNGGWTFGPTVALNTMKVDIDPFAETGAGGLSLAFGDQEAESQTLQGGFRFSYAMSRSWGVLSPHARLTLVKELENDSEVVLVSFVSDPFVNDPSQPSPGITIVTDDPDEEYARFGVGLSAVFVNGISAFVDYETYAGLRDISSHELSFGIRFERSFR
jgi:uncharacterized protein YhjY with autotransporter beta-barrel domain